MMDEGCKKTLFTKGKEGNAKLFMEGRGLPMKEKYQTPERMFVGTKCFITMNTLPSVLKQKGPNYETEDESIEREAFRNRCEFFE